MKPLNLSWSKEKIKPWSKSKIRQRSKSKTKGTSNTQTTTSVKVVVAKSESRQRSKPRTKGGQSDPQMTSLTKAQNNIHRHHDLNRIDSLCSPGSPYTPCRKVGSSRKREQMNGIVTSFQALAWDMKSVDSDEDEVHKGFDRYSSVEGSPIKKRKLDNKMNLIMTPIENPLHRLPPRMMLPRRSRRKQIKSSSVIGNRKKQVKRNIATTLANVKEDELGNSMYRPRSADDAFASKNANIFTRRSNNMNNHSGHSRAVPKCRVTRLDTTKNKDVRTKNKGVRRKDLEDTSYGRTNLSCKPRFALWSPIRRSVRFRSKDDDETETLDKKVTCEEKEPSTKPRFVVRSPIRMSRQRALMGQSGNLSPTSMDTSGTAPAKYIYASGSYNTVDDDALTFRTGTAGEQCKDLNVLTDAVCVGLENGISYANKKGRKVDAGCHSEGLLGGVVKSAAQIENTLVEEWNALGGKTAVDFEPAYECVNSTCADYDRANDRANDWLYGESESSEESTETNDKSESTGTNDKSESTEANNKSFRNTKKKRTWRLFG